VALYDNPVIPAPLWLGDLPVKSLFFRPRTTMACLWQLAVFLTKLWLTKSERVAGNDSVTPAGREGGASSPFSANGRTRPVTSSMLKIGGEAAFAWHRPTERPIHLNDE
jgi:hypothetical protein